MSLPRDLDEYTEQELAREIAHRAERRSYGRCDYCNRLKDEGRPCKFPERHRQAMTIAEAVDSGKTRHGG